MSFRPDAVRGATPFGGGALPSTIDFRLARRHVLNEYRRRRLARHEICDAHPELVRNALNCGRTAPDPCPVCEQATMLLVSYVFGARMPAHGRCISADGELAKLNRTHDELTCYVVEVCPGCRWNHLARTFRFGRNGGARQQA